MPTQKKEFVDSIIKKAFLNTHCGYSTDDVVICDKLNQKFIASAKQLFENSKNEYSPESLNFLLFNLRKSGQLGPVTTKRSKVRNQDNYIHAVEIASRFMEDKHKTTIDHFLCNPEARIEFDVLAKSIVPGYSSFEYRKAALKLRKTSQLKPELLKRVLESSITSVTHSAFFVESNLSCIPRSPGVYIFSDARGVLYIGESKNLFLRISKHLDHSDRKLLAQYFWKNGVENVMVEILAFNPGTLGSTAKERRALESSLIESRHPRFNKQ